VELSSVVVVDVPRSLEQPLVDKIKIVKLDKRKVFMNEWIAPAIVQARFEIIVRLRIGRCRRGGLLSFNIGGWGRRRGGADALNNDLGSNHSIAVLSVINRHRQA